MNSNTQQHALGESIRASGPAGPHARALTKIGFTLLALVVLMLMLTSAGGCSTERVERYRAANAELKAALAATEAQLADAEALLAQLDAQIAATPDGPDKLAAVAARDQVADAIDKGAAFAQKLSEGIEQTEAAIDAALAGDAAGAVNTIGPYIASKSPPPWNVYILAGTTVLGGLLGYLQKRKADAAQREVKAAGDETRYLGNSLKETRDHAEKTRLAAESVITAIEHEKGGDGTIDFEDESTKISLRSRMSTEARDLVEQVRRAQPARLKAVNTSAA